MKLFGEFLLEKGLVDEEGIVGSLMEQVRRMPSYVELAWRLKLLGNSDVLRLLKAQATGRGGFFETLKELGLFTPAFQEALVAELGTVRVPLGQILVERGLISQEALTHALDEYLGGIKGNEAAVKASVPTAEPSPAAVAAVPAPDASAAAGGPGVFLELFSPGILDRVLLATEQLPAGGEATRAGLKGLFDGIHEALGICRLSKMAQSEQACSALEAGLVPLLRIPDCGPDIARSLVLIAKTWVELFQKLRGAVEGGASEADFFAVAENEEIRSKLGSLVDILKFDIDMAGFSTTEGK